MKYILHHVSRLFVLIVLMFTMGADIVFLIILEANGIVVVLVLSSSYEYYQHCCVFSSFVDTIH